MRLLLKVTAFLVGTVLLVLLACFCWLYFYTRDLPDITILAQYAPTTVTKVNDPCLASSMAVSSSVAVPYEVIGRGVRNAISAVETSESDPGVLRTTLLGLLTKQPQRRTMIASWYVSRTMCYAPSTSLKRQLSEIRTAIQIERHYSRQQMFAIFANRSYFGAGLVGVESGADFYFHKKPAELSLSEASLLAGMIRGPSRLSPFKHPDRALMRRNQVIDAMVENGSITAPEAQTAKAAQLGVVSDIRPVSQ